MSACAGADAIARNASAASEAAGICQRRTAPLPAGGGVQFDDAAGFRAHRIDQPLPGDLAFMDKVRPHGGQIQIIGAVDLTVQQHDRDLGLLGFFQHGIPAGGHDRGQQDRPA